MVKLIDETKEKITDVLTEYFYSKQGDYDYKHDLVLQENVRSTFQEKLEDILVELEELDQDIDDLLEEQDELPSRYEMMAQYDAYREDELNGRR